MFVSCSKTHCTLIGATFVFDGHDRESKLESLGRMSRLKSLDRVSRLESLSLVSRLVSLDLVSRLASLVLVSMLASLDLVSRLVSLVLVQLESLGLGLISTLYSLTPSSLAGGLLPWGDGLRVTWAV